MPDGEALSLDELRRQARDLWRLLSSGDGAAIERVLRTHPKYAGRPTERLRVGAVKLRDAQEVVAREKGFEGWEAAMASGQGPPHRWDPRSQIRQEFRTLDFARLAGSKHARIEHVLDALASAGRTAAASVLRDLGYEAVAAKGRISASGTSSTPAQQALVAFAAGLALGSGDETVADEHVLLAFAYTEAGVDLLRTHNIDPDDVIAALRLAGMPTPSFAPPVPRLPSGPLGPRVYFRGPGTGVAPEIHRRYPPGTVHTGFNTSRWKPGWAWVDAEDEVPLEEIVRSVITDPEAVEVVPVREAADAERQAADRERKD